MNPNAITKFIDELEATGFLGQVDRNNAEEYENNITRFSRSVSLIVKPQSVEDVRVALKAAALTSTPVYPISAGKNWGFGSRLPVTSGCAIIDLGNLNKIRSINHELGFAVVEPGVTQKQLSDALLAANSPFYLDVTGSGSGTSILGNALDRGIAYNSLRAETVYNFEVVLPTGELLQSGMAGFTTGDVGHLYPHGIGPRLDTLFSQSNFGVVTAATVKLRERSSSALYFQLSFDDEQLEQTFDAMARLRRSGTFSAIARTGDRSRSFETMAPLLRAEYERMGIKLTWQELEKKYNKMNRSMWTSFGLIEGSSIEVKAKKKVFAATMRKHGKLRFFSPRQLNFLTLVAKHVRLHDLFCSLEASRSLAGLSFGVPTDAALAMVAFSQSSLQKLRSDHVDKAPGGFMLVVPLCPFQGHHVRKMDRMVRAVARDFDVKLGVTLNTISETVVEGVISLKYDSPPEGHRCAEVMYAQLIESGYAPYRLNVGNMELFQAADPANLSVIKALKSVFDPKNIMAPGRYDGTTTAAESYR